MCVAGEALHVWWGDGAGPQDAAGLTEANVELSRHLATIKREADEDGVIRISEMDFAA